MEVTMTTTVEVLFEDHVLKPLGPIEGIREHEKAWVLIRPSPSKDTLRRMFGTMSHADAQSMRETIAQEFEKVEGQW